MSYIQKDALRLDVERQNINDHSVYRSSLDTSAIEPPPSPKETYNTLQALRAFAAGLVVLYHTNHSIFGTAKYWADQPFGNFLQFGRAGVEFFFVLSGFIIYMAHHRDIGVSDKLAGFTWKRFRRVYPVYWVLLLAVIPVYLIAPSFGDGSASNIGTIADSLLLVHVFGNREILTVSWTLFHEIAFYGFFALLIAHRRLGILVMGAWLVSSALWVVMPSLIPPGIASYLSPLNLLFGMGMGAAWIVRHVRPRLPWAITVAGTLLFLAAGADEALGHHLAQGPLAILYGIGSSLIVIGAVELERTGKVSVPRSLVFLGNASYSIYLVHFVALSVLAKVLLKASVFVALPHALIFLLLVAGSVGVGVVYHLIVEVPLLRVIGRIKFSPGRISTALGNRARWVKAFRPVMSRAQPSGSVAAS